MTPFRIAALALFALGIPHASAQDSLKIAIGQINNWENQAPTLGEDAGIFKKHNLKIEAFGTQGAARPSRRWCRARPISAPVSALPA
jgi:ABC-type nitrate/sulfonate/bicarbonate transport system substrate-binding protein